MIKYLDTNKIKIPEGFFNDLNVPKLFNWLDNLPAVDVQEVRHGRWIPSKIEAIKTTFICSECNREVDMTNDYFGKPSIHVGKHYPYCHCGALMDGKE